MGKLIILFIAIPLVELLLLIEMGKIIGTFYTIALIFATGIVGVFLAKTQGFLVVRNMQTALASGDMPGQYMVDGLFILVGGLVLLTPGLLTDIFGFSLLIPSTRKYWRYLFLAKLRHWVTTGQVRVLIK